MSWSRAASSSLSAALALSETFALSAESAAVLGMASAFVLAAVSIAPVAPSELLVSAGAGAASEGTSVDAGAASALSLSRLFVNTGLARRGGVFLRFCVSGLFVSGLLVRALLGGTPECNVQCGVPSEIIFGRWQWGLKRRAGGTGSQSWR